MFLQKRKEGSRSLNHTTLLAFLMSFLIPSLILIILLFVFFITISLSDQQKEYQNTLKILSAHLVNHVDANSGLSLNYLFDSKISSLYYYLNKQAYEEDDYNLNQLAQSYTSTLNTRMTLIGDSIIGVGFIPRYHNNDRLFYLKKYGQFQELSIPGDSLNHLYKPLLTRNQVIYFIKSRTCTVPNSISLVRCAKNVDKQQVIGYILVDISLEFIFEPLKEIAIGSDSGIILESPAEDILFSTNSHLDSLQAYLHTDTADGTSAIPNYDIYSYTDEKYGFTFHYFSSRNELYRNFGFAFLLVLLFYSAMMLAAAFIFRLISHKITHSIRPILNTMDGYNAGDSHIQCDTSQCSISEIAAISVNLNGMIQKINTHINNEYRFKMEQKIAEYQSLQSEINPHFLHNILNLLIAQNRLGDKVSLENSIISLSRLFRYTCEHNYNSTIIQEFDFIKDYLYLQKVRFDERLIFDIFIEPGLGDFQIPKLLIQPLIENAIVHGLEPSDQCEHIHLSAVTLPSRSSGSFIAITVINTGSPYIENRSYKRVGLKNIEERLSIFSPDSFLILRGGIDKPTKCIIMLPCNRTGEKEDSHVYSDSGR